MSEGDEPRRAELLELASVLRASIVPLSRELRRVGDVLTPTQVSVLGAILRAGPIAMGELAAHERLSPPMISRVVTALGDHGLIDRLPDVDDRRVCRVAISETGQQWIKKGQAERNAMLAARLATLDADELEALTVAAPILERLAHVSIAMLQSPVVAVTSPRSSW